MGLRALGSKSGEGPGAVTNMLEMLPSTGFSSMWFWGRAVCEVTPHFREHVEPRCLSGFLITASRGIISCIRKEETEAPEQSAGW